MSLDSKSPEISAAKSLFMGSLIEENIFPFPAVAATEADTLKMIIESVDKFMQGYEHQYRLFDRKGEQPQEYIDALKDLGLFGLIIPEELGGMGLSNAGYARVLQQTSRLDASTSLTIGAHSSIGMKGILLFGNQDQKHRYLPKLASGEMIAAFCLTEAGSGSDAASIKTHAVKQPDGSWKLNGEKIWITNGAFAELMTVFARTDTDEGKMTAFIVERSFGGVSSGPKEDKMGIRASATTTVAFNDVIVPAQNVLGEVGKGFKVAMGILNNGRTGLGGGCVGAMKRCIELATKQAQERKQFGRPIFEFPLVREKLAQMAVQCYATESAVQMVAHYIDSNFDDYSTEAAISKIFASESMWQVANDALQVAAGNGYMCEFPYERIVRDSRINLIFEGTNEILRLYVGLSGLKDAGDYLKGLKAGVGGFFNDPIKGFGVLKDYAGKKFSRVTPLGRPRLTAVCEELREEALAIERYTQQLAAASETLLIRHGKDIIGQQLPTKRVADIAVDLFVSLCVLSRVSTKIVAAKSSNINATDYAQELSIAKIFIRQAKRRINVNLRRLEKNEDLVVLGLADYLGAQGGYPWDVI